MNRHQQKQRKKSIVSSYTPGGSKLNHRGTAGSSPSFPFTRVPVLGYPTFDPHPGEQFPWLKLQFLAKA